MEAKSKYTSGFMLYICVFFLSFTLLLCVFTCIKNRNPKESRSPIEQHFITGILAIDEPEGKKKQGSANENEKVKESNCKISITSYNILTQKFISKKNRNKYFSLDTRMEKIIKELNELNSDIICLQEVDYKMLEKYLRDGLKSYEYVFSENEGSCFLNVIFYRRFSFEKIFFQTLDLSFININGNRGVCKLNIKDRAGNFIAIYNVHFPWSPKHELFKCQIMNKIFENALITDVDHVFISGDFNSLPNSYSLKMIYIDNYVPVEKRLTEIKKMKERKKKELTSISEIPEVNLPEEKKSELPTSQDDFEESHKIRRLHYEGNKDFYFSFEENALEINNRFKFRSSYEKYKIYYNNVKSELPNYILHHPDFTNFTEMFYGTLDYIFYSKKFVPIRLLKLPSVVEVEKEDYLPNSKYPSDHVKIFCEFKY